MRPVKLTNLLICAIATFLFGATYVAFKEPTTAVGKKDSSSADGLDGDAVDRPGNASGRARPEANTTDALLLPFANRALPRHLLQAPSYMRMLNTSTKGIDIDIALGEVDVHDLDQQTVIVTGLSKYTEEEGIGLIASAQIHMPFKKIILYDLGVKRQTLARLTPLCNVEVRKFQYGNYPSHVKTLRNNAWKLIVITEVLVEFGSVFYAHPHLRFRAPISILFPFVKEMHGFIPSMADDSSLLKATHSAMLKHMRVPSSRLAEVVSNGPIISGDMLLFVMNSSLVDRALPGLRKCFLRSKCLSPPGAMWRLAKPAAKRQVHHFDLSALSLMMFKVYGEDWAPGDGVRRMMKRLFVVLDEGDPLRELSWSFRCNPPKQEFDPARLLQKL